MNKYNKCCHFGKGGWCGFYHDEVVTLTHKGVEKRIVCVSVALQSSAGMKVSVRYFKRKKNDDEKDNLHSG